MGIRDESAAAGTASDAWGSRDPRGLRDDDDDLRGRFSPAFLVAQSMPAPADTAPDADRAALLAIRDDIAGLRAEVGWLSELVASDRREAGHTQAQQAAAPALLPPAAELRTDAINRVDAAATHVVRTASTPPDARRQWERTDEAVARLLQAFTRQAQSKAEAEPARPDKADAGRLRVERQRARLESERSALRKFRSRRWWTRSALG
jgi:hypothetical protein